MSEFNLAYDQAVNQQGASGGQGEVEWYSGGQYAASSYNYDQGGNSAAAFGSFDDEPPLLEELGIDIPKILRKTSYILTYRLGKHDLLDLDLGGPLVFVAVLGAAHLLTAKFNFGVLLGWSVVCSLVIWFVVSSMVGPEGPERQAVDLYSCMCLLGYGLLPLVLYSLLSLIIPKGMASNVFAVLCTLWSALTAAKLFTRRSPSLTEFQGLIGYPCLLMYTAFALLTVA